ncbi:cell wall integrity and stress response component [Pyrenophora seminiperda CCB06]|uniref:Cell wall integrity and stress response component n=1 Tax=Pyrenophora seminiperda CCB06 TaxID=1302712 RepID=A0A3M7MIU9_9PLEO|nr:cell wall integrity and stress response component [Pyrenophora seminiperda CCB06]
MATVPDEEPIPNNMIGEQDAKTTEGSPTTITMAATPLAKTSARITSVIFDSQVPTASPSFTKTQPDPAVITGGASPDRKNNSGLSSGAVAGISIGTLIIGAVLAFIAAFFLFKRRNRQTHTNVGGTGYTSYGESAPELVMMQQKSVGNLGGRHSPYVQVSQTAVPRASPMPAPIPLPNTAPEDAIAFLPPVAHDNEVHGRVSGLLDRLHEHVEKFYRDVHASITPSMEHGIAKFGSEGVNMAELIQGCSSPTTALKHALVAYVLGITAPKRKGDEQETIFPEELERTSMENSTDTSPNPSVSTAAALHRRISVYLYTATSGTQNPRESRLTQSNIREAAEHFSLTFFPWANPAACDQDKDDDLGRIITAALEVRIWLFGQPGMYEFEWEETGRRGVLISPGLVRRTYTNEGMNSARIVDGVVVAM